ncbi:tRNA uridine-5-carboxymethylaminomethyl(34) synthesis GTPase MnmE [Rufibacter glacialis]|uniref:tRNA modification GTPase MnmE n=1 Tax=Rufibacter glacialis TaxID=1259555 RepID=A0A5M8Q7L3_9BACT|nr:tRNA uridine-5-carboxymethylaminomethyl(34) synthesis GTPase MnmE [Rufibacter glacialis]KAA6431915.1 tRNA uridine-5-carboxymethylaminomethyl(34) synthesis GTPase MnmE [Rufibacter glacialis]GGK80452.1 tRNA modification GTPase MnmE [Rufibacter glacialis]
MIPSLLSKDTIVALATASGHGAIAIIRLSGPQAISIVQGVFKGKNLQQQPSHTLHFGTIRDEERILDEVVVSLFKAPASYTKEDVVEVSCHGSPYITEQLLKLFLQKGARLAEPGEFTKRAFLNGQFDLAQAEAVADLIASDSALTHQVAMKQMRGGFSQEIKALRAQLIHFASMIELELDFSEEDVEFADRTALRKLISQLQRLITDLLQSFEMGNVLKNGVPTVIAGKPNAGKSTLLNALLNEEKAIVSEIPGTTRDVIEDEALLGGIRFRFIDTAGLRETLDTVEAIGVARTKEQLKKAALVLYLFDLSSTTPTQLQEELAALEMPQVPYLLLANKKDLATPAQIREFSGMENVVFLSAGTKEGMEDLKHTLLEQVHDNEAMTGDRTIVTNLRHYQSLQQTSDTLAEVQQGLDNGLTGDWLAADIRRCLFFLGQITGEITTDDLLDNIFTKFCIGK